MEVEMLEDVEQHTDVQNTLVDATTGPVPVSDRGLAPLSVLILSQLYLSSFANVAAVLVRDKMTPQEDSMSPCGGLIWGKSRLQNSLERFGSKPLEVQLCPCAKQSRLDAGMCTFSM
ncbi:hypothetical protein Q8A73_000155 [Channa argus]|nr:hypothetical protein Q8A73_000155 [Channa argus]